MLVQFSFNNFRCFRSETTLSLIASDRIEHSNDSIVRFGNYSVLKSSVIYGANASGKTKLFQAFLFMDRMICELAKENKFDWQSRYTPFELAETEQEESSSFEVIFVQKGVQFRYGFEINRTEVLAEWLYRQSKNKEIEIFYRDETGIVDYHKSYIKSQVVDIVTAGNLLRNDALLLTILPVWNNSLAKSIIDWFFSANVLSATRGDGMSHFSTTRLATPMKNKILMMMRSADINIDDLNIREMNFNDIPEEIKALIKEKGEGKVIDGVNANHKTFDKNGLSHSSKSFSLESDESYGTYRLFALSAPIIDTLENGKVLFVDEIDNGLHSDLLRAIVALFQDPFVNKKNAQLIINTHDIGLLDDSDLFKHDQIYIAQKDRFGEATLTSLLSYNVDSNKKIGELYREGRFGGVPYLVKFMKNVLSSN